MTRSKSRLVAKARDPMFRKPKGCESKNHKRRTCYGYVRTCPVCGTKVCWADGAHDEYEKQQPGICDTCAVSLMPAEDS